MKVYDLTNIEQPLLENIVNGLSLFHSRCMDQIKMIEPSAPGAADMKNYYLEKRVEAAKQIIQIRKLMLNSKD